MGFPLCVASQPRSSVTEQDLLDTLTEHARRVAGSVLSQPRSGLDLEADVRVRQWINTCIFLEENGVPPCTSYFKFVRKNNTLHIHVSRVEVCEEI